MKRCVALVLLGLLASACAVAGPAPSQTPGNTNSAPFLSQSPTGGSGATPTPKPSPGCEFMLLIKNETASTVSVAVNTHAAGNIGSGNVLWLYAHQWPMPWDVVVARASDGVQLAAQHYENSNETEYLPVTDESIAMTASNCG